MRSILFLSIFLLFTLPSTYAQAVYEASDRAIFQRLCHSLDSFQAIALPELTLAAGKQLAGTPYVAHTLEKPGNEQLIVNLRGVDCTTFVESTWAIARTLKTGDTTFQAYCQQLQQVRYRKGEVNAYPSRLHYFLDWMDTHQADGSLTILTQTLGGKPYLKNIRFMTEHRSLYPGLKQKTAFQAMQTVEDSLNQRKHYFIPKQEVVRMEQKLQDGDIIGITSSVQGLDIVHVGLAIRQRGRIHLLHASTDGKKVMISDKPLADYLLAHSSQTGIVVARLR
jgi:hypothetical protein